MDFERDEGPILDLGHAVRARLVDYGTPGDKDAGVEYWHPCKVEGASWVPVSNPKQDGTWLLESREPLTLSPSLLCRVCGHHGFIREGKWVPA